MPVRLKERAERPPEAPPKVKFTVVRPPTLHLRLPALPAGAHSAALLWQGAAALAGLVLGAGQIYGGAAPFGLAMVLGCPVSYMFSAAAGAALGGLLFQPGLLALQLIGALAAALAARRLLKGRWQPTLAACGVLLAEHLAAGFGAAVTAQQNVAVLGTAVLAAGFGAAVAALPPQKPRGACLWLAMLAACVQRLPLLGLAPGLLAASAAGLCAAYAGTLEQSAVLSLALAAAFTAASPDLCYAALAVALGTLTAACLCPGERLRGVGAFAVGCTLGALTAPDLRAVLPLAGGAAAGAVLFLLLPEKLLRAFFPAVLPAGHRVEAAVNGATARQLDRVANALCDVADTVNAVCDHPRAPRSESYDFVVEYAARRLCQNCARRSQCWLQGYSTMVDGLYHLKPVLEAEGRAAVEDLPGQLSTCIHPADMCTVVTHGYRLWRSRRQRRAQAAALRSALTEQYTAVAGALAQLADKLGQSSLPDPQREARAAQLFSGLGLEPLECHITTDLSGRLSAGITVARTAFTPEELTGLTAELSRLCRRDLAQPDVSHHHTVTTLAFAERPLLRASFACANRPADGQTVSGDACDQFCDNAGRAQMLLCDGMGTGRAAAVDGQMAARLTAELLRAGFAAESAARLVNVALNLKNAEQESGATLDLLTVDLYTGRAGLFKAGAAPSFVIRGGVPRPLEGVSLPIGVLDTVVGRSTALALDAGDTVVMVTDGALADGSEWLLQQLTLCAQLGSAPAEMAQTLVDAAARRAAGRRDDITAAVLRLEKA